MSQKRNHERLLSWNELEPWMKDNEYILTGYRPVSASYQKSIKSVLRVHNETANIWSHLLGSVLFAAYLYHFISETWPTVANASSSDILAVSIYYLAVVNCFVLSTSFHTFSNHSKEVHKFGNELDHLGVVLVIYGSAIPATYFQFYCNPIHRNIYWTLSTSLAVASAIFTLQPKFRQPIFRKTRFYMYSLLGLSCFLPVAHGLLSSSYYELDQKMSLSHFVGLALIQFSGATIYAARVPERFFPQAFDIVGHSHFIMHVLVVFGALTFEKGLLKALARWTDGRNSCSD